MPSAGLAPQIPRTIQSRTKIQTNMACTGRNRELFTFEPSSQGKNKSKRMEANIANTPISLAVIMKPPSDRTL